MDKKVIKAIMLTNPFFYNIFSKKDSKCDCKCSDCKCSNSSKQNSSTGESSDEESTDDESDNEDNKKKHNQKEKPKKTKEKIYKERIKELREEYNKRTKELRDKFEEYKKIIDDKDKNSVSETVSKHLCGFKNYGNTCYFNAAMQNITHNKDLVKAILDHVSIAADKGSINEEIIAFHYLIVKIYQQEEERKRDNNGKVIFNELDDLRYFIAYNGILGNSYNCDKKKFYGYKQQDSQELLSLFIDDLNDKIKSIEDIFYFETKLKKTCTNDTCNENKKEEGKDYLNMFKLGLKYNNNEEQIIDIFNKEFIFEEMNDFKCEECSKDKGTKYKNNNSKKLKELQDKFYKCETCKNFFAAKEQYKEDKSKIDYKKINIDNIKEDNNDLQFLEGKKLIASLREDKILGLIHNTQCKICKKEYNELLKEIYTYKKGRQVLLKKIGNYFIMYSNRAVTDFNTLKEKRLNKNIVFETSFKLEPGRHGVKKEENLDLVGIICHNGDPYFGHYFSYNKIDDKWYLFDDDKVSEVPNNNIKTVTYGTKKIQELNFILFYKKQ